MIYDITTGDVIKVADGNTFLLSPDGKHIVVSDIQTIDGQEIYSLRCIDLINNDEMLIYTGQIIHNMTWSTHGARLYYSIYKDTQPDAAYPYELYYYDVQTEQSVYIMDMITSALYPSTVDYEVLLMCIFTYKNQPIPITYIVK